MSEQLHLLRPFARWRWKLNGKWVPIDTVDDAVKYSRKVQQLGFEEFLTATARIPTRHEELRGGSIYFVRKGVALFRMPFLRVEERSERAAEFQGKHLIVVRPEVIRTADKPRVGFCRGWRYATASQVPPDLTERQIDEALPPDLADHIDTMGIG